MFFRVRVGQDLTWRYPTSRHRSGHQGPATMPSDSRAGPQGSDGNRVVATGRYLGTHRARGRRASAQFCIIYTVADDMIVEGQQYVDTARIREVMDLWQATGERSSGGSAGPLTGDLRPQLPPAMVMARAPPGARLPPRSGLPTGERLLCGRPGRERPETEAGSCQRCSAAGRPG